MPSFVPVRRGRRALRGDTGMVTAELATVLPVLVLVTWACVLAVLVAQARVRCADAAREAALAIARGDSSRAQSLATEVAGRPVEIVSSRIDEDSARVEVRFVLHPLVWIGSITIAESAVADGELRAAG